MDHLTAQDEVMYLITYAADIGCPPFCLKDITWSVPFVSPVSKT